MAENGNGSRLSIPYPVMAAMVALFIWLAGGTLVAVYMFGNMSADLRNLNTTLTNQEVRNAEERKKIIDEMMLMQTYIHNDRERIIKLEAQRGRSN